MVELKGVMPRDVDAEVQGEWKEAPNHPGVKLKVRSLNNPDYRRAKAYYDRRMQRKFGNEPADPQWIDREFGKIVAQHLLLDWEGVEPAYTKEVGMEALSDPRYRDLANDVVVCAARVGDRDVEETETDAKNSKAGSSGKQAGAST